MFSPEFELLLLSLRLDDIDEAAAKAQRIIEGNQTDWEELYRLADSHAVKPQLYGLLSLLRQEFVPEGFMEKLQSAYRQNLVDQLDHVNEFFRIRNRLSEEGITVVPFKGFWLAGSCYGDLALRESGDIDVFIRFSDLGKIHKVMPETGYLVGAPYLPTVNPHDCEFNYGLYSGGRCISLIEYHWRIAPAGFGLDITLEELAPQVIASKIQDHPLEAFSPSATLLLTVMHHGGKDAFRFLKQVYDIAMIITRCNGIDAGWLLREAGRYHCRTLVLVALKLASLITGAEVPASIVSESSSERVVRLAKSRMISLQIEPDNRRRARHIMNDWIFRIRSRDGLGVKALLTVRFIRKEFIPRLVPKRMHHLFMRKYIIPDYAREVQAAG